MDKRIANADAAIEKLSDGATILVGGFGTCGNPENLINAVYRKGTKNLTCVSNNVGMADFGLGMLASERRVKKLICSFPGQNKAAEQQVLRGEIEIELNPQGTLVERMRAGGAGIPAFYTPTGVGTVVAEGKEVREFKGRSIFWSIRCAVILLSSKRGRATVGETLSIERPRGISIPSWLRRPIM